MEMLFNAGTPNLQTFFCAQRGFYVSLYQRPFSWDKDNAETLINDFLNSFDKEIDYVAYSHLCHELFLGNVILYEEKNKIIKKNNTPMCHYDSHNLISKIDVVVDGQQRISVIGLLGTVLIEIIKDKLTLLAKISSPPDEIIFLKNELSNIKNLVDCLYSIDLSKISNANPPLKPKIIRAESDYWSLNTPGTYQSDFAKHFDEIICGTNPSNTSVINNNSVMKNIYDVFKGKINNKISSMLSSTTFIPNLLSRSGIVISPIYNIIAPHLHSSFHSFTSTYPNLQNIFIDSTYLLALTKFLLNGTYFGEMVCKSEDVSLDVFQSLNATGTPLTAFEVYKPKIFSHFGSIYTSTVQDIVKDIEDTIDKCRGKGKSNVTDKIVTTTAMVIEGKELSPKFTDERDWLFDFHSRHSSSSPGKIQYLVNTLYYQADYYENIIYPNKPKTNSSNFSILNHFNSKVTDINKKIHPNTITFDADETALCLYFLRDAKHNMAHYIISVFYGKILEELNKSPLNPTNIQSAFNEFNCVCKAITAFYVFWAGGGVSGFPDDEYRKLFKNPNQNISILNSSGNQGCGFIKGALRDVLASKNIYDASNQTNAKTLWVNSAKNTEWYSRSNTVTKFALFVAFHDAAPDTNPGNEGLMINGMNSSYTMLSCAKWYSTDFECIEHIATRDIPSNKKYSGHFDQNIYPGNYSVVDKIGNLTLLSKPVNSSIYSEWPDKVFYYWHLTTPSSTTSGPFASTLQKALGITSLPPSLSSLSAALKYQAHLAPLVVRGVAGLKWDKVFIDKRSEHLCERIFDRLDHWLR